ncbi:MAG TPA: hypothetical protein VM900_05985 [Sphingomonas sp.]|nr:hypothetical protein [Sphingomonas sp.]
MKAALLPALMLALVAAADDPLARRTAGPPQPCIDPNLASSPQITDQGTIIYRGTAKRLWVSTPVGHCPMLRPFTTLIIERFGSQLCRNDRFRVLEPGATIPSAACRFGEFVPWDKS